MLTERISPALTSSLRHARVCSKAKGKLHHDTDKFSQPSLHQTNIFDKHFCDRQGWLSTSMTTKMLSKEAEKQEKKDNAEAGDNGA